MGFKPRSNFRRKQRIAAESDDDDDIDVVKHISKAKAKPAPAQPPARAPTKLSFRDDEESDIVFKKKKKKRPKARGVSTADLDGNDAPAGGSSYSEATLADLKEQTPQMPPKFAAGATACTREGSPPFNLPKALLECSRQFSAIVSCAGPAVFKMSGSFRAKATITSHESAMPDSFKVSSVSAPRVDIPPPPSGQPQPSAPIQPPQPSASSATSTTQPPNTDSSQAVGIHDNSDLASDDIDIPSAEMIRLVKEKRQRLRGAHMAPGYIPSDTAMFRKAAEYKQSEDTVKKGSDDESGDDDNDDLRVRFSGGVLSGQTTCRMLRCFCICAAEHNVNVVAVHWLQNGMDTGSCSSIVCVYHMLCVSRACVKAILNQQLFQYL